MAGRQAAVQGAAGRWQVWQAEAGAAGAMRQAEAGPQCRQAEIAPEVVQDGTQRTEIRQRQTCRREVVQEIREKQVTQVVASSHQAHKAGRL